MKHPQRQMLTLHQLIRRLFGFSFDLTGLAFNDDDVLLDLATGRD